MSEIAEEPEQTPLRRDQLESTPAQEALRRVVDELEIGASRVGWDRPPSLYALVYTAELLKTPGLPEDIAASLRSEWDGSAEHLSAVAQDSLPQDDLEALLPKIAWPPTVAGAALTVERIILPDGADKDVPEDSEDALAFAENHPDRTDIRVVVGVDRQGNSWCEVRARSFDERENVGRGTHLVPVLVDGLRLGLTETPEESV